MERGDAELIAEVLSGQTASFEPLVQRYQSRVFAMARRYCRRDSEVEDVVQEVFIKAFQRLSTFRAEAPFEHWLMRLAVRTCYDFLRSHQRSRETVFADIDLENTEWLDRFIADPGKDEDAVSAARELVQAVFEQLSAPARLVLTLLEIEDRSVKEVAELTGWSIALVKVRAFRARAEMRRRVERIAKAKYL